MVQRMLDKNQYVYECIVKYRYNKNIKSECVINNFCLLLLEFYYYLNALREILSIKVSLHHCSICAFYCKFRMHRCIYLIEIYTEYENINIT